MALWAAMIAIAAVKKEIAMISITKGFFCR